MDNQLIYTSKISGINYSISESILYQYYCCENNEQLAEMLNSDDTIPLHGISKHDFLRVLIDFGNFKNYKHGTKAQKQNYKKINSYIKSNSFSILEQPCNDIFKGHYAINADFYEFLIKDMDFFKTNLQKMIFLYYKLCKTFTFDEKFYANGQKGKYAKIHEDINRLYTLDQENNKVVCYEIVSILARFADELGIKYMMNSLDVSIYGRWHKSITMLIDGNIILMDPTKLMLFDDLYHAKVGLPFTNIKCQNQSLIKQAKFNQALAYVTEHYDEATHSNNTALNEYWKTIFTSFEDLNGLENINDKLDYISLNAHEESLPFFDRLSHAFTCMSKILQNEISQGKVIFRCIHNKMDNTTGLALAINPEPKGVADPHMYIFNNYMVYDGKSFKKYSQSELQEMFDEEKFGYIYRRTEIEEDNVNFESHLPGIFDYNSPTFGE